jgi:hypothetical protein
MVRRLLILVVVLVGLAVPVDALAQDFHGYSVAYDTNRAPDGYRGVAATRWDNQFAGIPNNGCTQPITGHAVYQAQWLALDADDRWVEVGTGHQCNDGFRYWYWGWGSLRDEAEPFELGGWIRIDNVPGRHRFRLERIALAGCPGGVDLLVATIERTMPCSGAHIGWAVYVDATRVGLIEACCSGHFVSAGLESYAPNAVTLNNGRPGTQNYDPMEFRSTQNNWLRFAGFDDEKVDAPMCGLWLSGSSWRTGQNVGGC